ncbi:MAG: ABC transporter substrate-binding protein [Phycisphaerae bacterium]
MRVIVAVLIAGLLLAGWLAVDRRGNIETRAVIHYAYWIGVPTEKLANETIVAEFERRNPDIKVEVHHHPWAAYFTKLYVGLASDTAPDVFRMSYGYLPDYAAHGALLPLDDLIAADDSFSLDELFPGPFESCHWDNHQLMMPVDYPAYIVFYNKELFDLAGVRYPRDDWTHEEFLQTALRLRDGFRRAGRVDHWAVTGLYFPSWVHEFGGQILDRERMVCTIDSPESIHAIQFLHDLVHAYDVAVSDARAVQRVADLFAAGRVAMSFGESYMIERYRRECSFDWDITYRPKGVRRTGKALAVGLGIWSRTRHREAAWRLVKFFVSPFAQEVYAKTGALTPIRKSVAHSSLFLPEAGRKPANKAILTQMEDTYLANWMCLQWGQLRLELYHEILPAITNPATPEQIAEACRRAAASANRVLDEAYRREQ